MRWGSSRCNGLGQRFRTDPRPALSSASLKTASDTLETMFCLLPEPLHDAAHVITIRDVIAQGGEAMRFAALLHFPELLEIELVFLDGAPIVGGVVHRETRGQGAIGADDEPILATTAAPVFSNAAHEALHVLQAGNGVDHFVALALLVNEPIQEIINHGEILRPNIGIVLMEMLEVLLLPHGSFVDVEG